MRYSSWTAYRSLSFTLPWIKVLIFIFYEKTLAHSSETVFEECKSYFLRLCFETSFSSRPCQINQCNWDWLHFFHPWIPHLASLTIWKKLMMLLDQSSFSKSSWTLHTCLDQIIRLISRNKRRKVIDCSFLAPL